MFTIWVREVENGFVVTRHKEGIEEQFVTASWKVASELMENWLTGRLHLEIRVHESQEHPPGPDTRP